MDIDLVRADESLRAEADDLLDRRGLRRLLEGFATISIVGSYALRLMVWRDLDVAMHAPGITVADFFNLGKGVADLLGTWKMFFTNNVSPNLFPTRLDCIGVSVSVTSAAEPGRSTYGHSSPNNFARSCANVTI